MASLHAEVERGASTNMDYAQHEQTYVRFLTLTKWAVIHIIVILILMAIFLL